MATLEEIVQQFEDALGESAGTTIQPGTITPQGVTSSVSGKKKLSWPEIVEKINEGVGVRQNELLPEVPEGVSAQKFYRTAAQEGLLPSGLSTFSSSPFGSFQGRSLVKSTSRCLSRCQSLPQCTPRPNFGGAGDLWCCHCYG